MNEYITHNFDEVPSTEKRLLLAKKDKTIKGYVGDYFWERNSFNLVKNKV